MGVSQREENSLGIVNLVKSESVLSQNPLIIVQLAMNNLVKS